MTAMPAMNSIGSVSGVGQRAAIRSALLEGIEPTEYSQKRGSTESVTFWGALAT